jgi:hypothetical protein
MWNKKLNIWTFILLIIASNNTEPRGSRPPKFEHINTHGFRRDAQPA